MRRGTLSAAAVLLAAACSSRSTQGAAPTPTVSASPSASSSPAPICPNQETGGSCVGRLSAGEHRTEAFAVPFSYTSPARWSNEEDINGRYLLLPPGSSRLAADDAKGDFVGAYTPVQAAARNCGEEPEPGVDTTAAAIAKELAGRPGITATAPRAVSLGSLRGTVLDVRLAAGWRKSCPGDEPGTRLVPTISGGFRPELIGHAVVPGVAVRLYLLDTPTGTVAVELQDATGGSHLAQLDAVAQTFSFA